MSGDSSSAQVDPDPMCLTSFGDDSTEPPALPRCRDDALVDKDAVASNPFLSPVEVRTLTATGGFLPAGTTSTATRTIFHQPPLWFCPTEEMNSRTSIQYVTTYYSSCWKMKVLDKKIKANSGARSWRFYRLSTRLSVSGRVARVALWGGFGLGAGIVPEAGAFFW